jgi:diguanylate cyclase (GGDEF)-like protein
MARFPALTRTTIAWTAGLAAVYAVLYEFVVLETSFGTTLGAAFWPAAGITVSVLVLRPREEWPLLLAGVFVVETVLDARGDFDPLVALGMGVANCAEPLLAAVLLHRWLNRAPDISRLRDLGLFLAAAVVAGPALGALIGSVWPWILGVDPLWPRLGRWYLGDALGVLVIAPLIISVARPPERPMFRLSSSWTFVVLAIVAAFALPWRAAAALGLPFLVMPALMLVGLRSGTRAAAAGILAVGLLVETVTALGAGPFSHSGAFSGLLVAQVFLATCAITALIAAALMAGLVSRDVLALHDSLTGLANRRLLYDRLTVACRRLARDPGDVGVLFIDLNAFKAVNDRYGHAAGDQLLVAVAARLAGAVREQDTVARLGGDEFVVLAEHVGGEDGLALLAERIDEALRVPVVLADGAAVATSASVGWALATDADADAEALISHADRAMYVAKAAGRTAVPAAG